MGKVRMLNIVLCIVMSAVFATVAAMDARAQPDLTAFDFDPKAIDVTEAPQTVTVNMTVVDLEYGINLVQMQLMYFGSPPEEPPLQSQLVLPELTGGTVYEGQYAANVVFPQYIQDGDWHVTDVLLWNNAGVMRQLSEADLIAAGYPTILNVTSNPDFEGPALAPAPDGFTFEPTKVNILDAPQTVTVTAHITDTAGVAEAYMYFLSESGEQWKHTPLILTSGNTQDGMYNGTVIFDQDTELGTWHPGEVGMRDILGHWEYLSTAALQEAGYITDLEVDEFVGGEPPEANAGGPYSGDEGELIQFSSDSGGSDIIPGGDILGGDMVGGDIIGGDVIGGTDTTSLTYEWDFGDETTGSGPAPTHAYADNGVYAVTLTVTDETTGLTGSDETTATVANVAPTVGPINTPSDPVGVGTQLSASSPFTDPGTGDTHTAVWYWGDGSSSDGTVTEASGSGTVSDSHTYTTPGVYTVTLTVTDKDGDSGESTSQYVTIYDPTDGFVTGGGWIISPEGAYVSDPTLTGKANFGFVAKYKKGATAPSGQTQFDFKVADLKFHSTAYQWLVVAGAKAQFKGLGTINGSGDYGFMLTAVDAALTPSTTDDLFRIKIWDSSGVVYDNQTGAGDDAEPTTALAGGRIRIHKANAAPALLPEDTSLPPPFPCPANPEVWIPYRLSSDSQVVIRIYDVAGRLVRTLDLGYRPVGFYDSRSKAAYWDGHNAQGEAVASGVYFYTFQAGDFAAARKLLIIR